MGAGEGMEGSGFIVFAKCQRRRNRLSQRRRVAPIQVDQQTGTMAAGIKEARWLRDTTGSKRLRNATGLRLQEIAG